MARSKGEAREYLRAVQHEAGIAVPFSVIVDAMRAGSWKERAEVSRRALALLERSDVDESEPEHVGDDRA